jgi:hypothetical protein
VIGKGDIAQDPALAIFGGEILLRGLNQPADLEIEGDLLRVGGVDEFEVELGTVGFQVKAGLAGVAYERLAQAGKEDFKIVGGFATAGFEFFGVDHDGGGVDPVSALDGTVELPDVAVEGGLGDIGDFARDLGGGHGPALDGVEDASADGMKNESGVGGVGGLHS